MTAAETEKERRLRAALRRENETRDAFLFLVGCVKGGAIHHAESEAETEAARMRTEEEVAARDRWIASCEKALRRVDALEGLLREMCADNQRPTIGQWRDRIERALSEASS